MNDTTHQEGSPQPEVDLNLSQKDLAFLNAIRNLNADADDDQGDFDGETPATTTRIRAKTGLTKDEVNYRFNQRGFGQDDHGLIRMYPAPQLDNGALGPKSAELTDRGETVLDTALAGESVAGAGATADVDALRDRIADLEKQVEQQAELIETLEELVTRFDERETGAWDAEKADRFITMETMMATYTNAFQALDVNLQEHRPEKT